MGDLRKHIQLIKERCNSTNLNSCSMEVTLVDKMWWFANDNSVQFDHWTGVDSETFREKDGEFYTNSYIQSKVSDNIINILSQIDQKSLIKVKNSIKGF